MSFHTQYTLTWDTPEPEQDTMVSAVAPFMLGNNHEPSAADLEFVRVVINGEKSAKWYDSDHHLGEVSKNWPNTVFTMRCTAQEGEQWITFFKNGLSLIEDLIVPDFDPQRFEDAATAPLSNNSPAHTLIPATEHPTMCNQTRHILKWMNPVPTEDEMVVAAAPHILNTDDEITPADLEFVREVINGDDTDEWPNADFEVRELSKRWPETVFAMWCTAQDGEQWVAFFKNGLALTEELIEPEFNPERFDTHATVPRPITTRA